jgi:hypothetical protein
VEEIQKMLNRSVRAITGCIKTMLIAPLIAEVVYLLATTILNTRQRKYTAQLAGLSEGH